MSKIHPSIIPILKFSFELTGRLYQLISEFLSVIQQTPKHSQKEDKMK